MFGTNNCGKSYSSNCFIMGKKSETCGRCVNPNTGKQDSPRNKQPNTDALEQSVLPAVLSVQGVRGDLGGRWDPAEKHRK